MKEKMFGRDEVGDLLKHVRLETGMSRRQLAEALGSSESTIKRLEVGETVATDEMWNRCVAVYVLGQKYTPGQEAEAVAAVGGAGVGVASATTAVSAAGAVSGLSAAGMTSGLAALGLGSMATGIGVVAAIPIGVGLASYGVVKAIKAIVRANKIDAFVEEHDDVLEIRLKPISERPGADE